MRIISQTQIGQSVLKLPPLSDAAKYKPFALKILTWAGVSETDTSIMRARAIVGWMAAHALHPFTGLHPDGYTINTSVLPAGETWATFNAAFDTTASFNRDNAYWYDLYPDGRTMLERLIGTVASDGSVADDGMLTEYAANQWRVRNFVDFRAPQCTLQCKMAQVLLAAIGIPSTDLTTTGHDPMMFYSIETGEWLYIDPTFGEMQMLAGQYLTPLDLIQLSNTGRASEIIGQRLLSFAYPAIRYFEGERMPNGMTFMTIYSTPQWSGGISARTPYRIIGFAGLSATGDMVATASEVMPQLGCGVMGVKSLGTITEVRLRSNWPQHAAFERSDDNGTTWSVCNATDYIGQDKASVRYRSVTAEGFAGKQAYLAAKRRVGLGGI